MNARVWTDGEFYWNVCKITFTSIRQRKRINFSAMLVIVAVLTKRCRFLHLLVNAQNQI